MTRHLALIGHTKDGKTALARACAWCGRWLSDEDARRAEPGQPISHGICEGCREREFGQTPDGDAA